MDGRFIRNVHPHKTVFSFRTATQFTVLIHERKIEFSLRLPKHYVTNTYTVLEVYIHAFLTLVLGGSRYPALLFFRQRKREPSLLVE